MVNLSSVVGIVTNSQVVKFNSLIFEGIKL